MAGAGNGLTVRIVRHSQRKRGATDRLNLRSTAPVLDPTVSRPPGQYNLVLTGLHPPAAAETQVEDYAFNVR